MDDIILIITSALLLPLVVLAMAPRRTYWKEAPDERNGKELKRHDTGTT